MRNTKLTITCTQANCGNSDLCCPKDHEEDNDCKGTTVESVDSKNHNHCILEGRFERRESNERTYIDKLVGNKQEVRS